jgi:release factor glutamine methyltransferase
MSDRETPLTWGDALAWGMETLRQASILSPKLDASVLLAHVLDVPRTAVLAYPERALLPDQLARYHDCIALRASGEPVAYLTGHKEFMGLDLLVDPRVLVPRPETELVVEAALQLVAERLGELPEEEDLTEELQPDLLAADIGTGSGAIAVALAALEPRIGRIFAIDVSDGALAVARHNADRLAVSDRIAWLRGDLLDPLPMPVDLIVANLPYVSADPADVQPGVARYEPHIALFAGADGLDLIRRLIASAPGKLRPGGALVLEFGYQQRGAIADLLAATMPQAHITFGTDYAGWDRYVVARLS